MNISELTKKDIGRVVLYNTGFGKKEKGIIKSWNDKYIFVVYPRGNIEIAARFWDYTAAATRPEDLEYLS